MSAMLPASTPATTAANASNEVHAMLIYSIRRPARMSAAESLAGVADLQQSEVHSFDIKFQLAL
jgi:hypothetical protein